MSRVTNLMISVAGDDDIPNLESLSDWLAKPREDGYKGPECEVWAGTLNWADLDAVLAQIFATPWKYPEDVQVLVKDQDERSFRLYMYRDGSWNQFAPKPGS